MPWDVIKIKAVGGCDDYYEARNVRESRGIRPYSPTERKALIAENIKLPTSSGPVVIGAEKLWLEILPSGAPGLQSLEAARKSIVERITKGQEELNKDLASQVSVDSEIAKEA